MKPKSWDPKTKAKIILEGLRGRPVSEICSEYGVHNSQYYDWRDKFLKNVEKVFENGQATPRETRLKAEIAQLKELVGELTLELKKTDGFV
jgi:transposase-like protein